MVREIPEIVRVHEERLELGAVIGLPLASSFVKG
jgi:hypothetical protein